MGPEGEEMTSPGVNLRDKRALSLFSEIDSSAGTFKDAAHGDLGNGAFTPPEFTAAARSLGQECTVTSERIGPFVVQSVALD